MKQLNLFDMFKGKVELNCNQRTDKCKRVKKSLPNKPSHTNMEIDDHSNTASQISKIFDSHFNFNQKSKDTIAKITPKCSTCQTYVQIDKNLCGVCLHSFGVKSDQVDPVVFKKCGNSSLKMKKSHYKQGDWAKQLKQSSYSKHWITNTFLVCIFYT